MFQICSYIFSAASRGSATAFFGLSLSVRLQSACWCRRARRENDVEMLQNNTKYLAKKPSKSFNNRPTIMKNDEKHSKSMKKTSLERCRRRSAHLGGRPHAVRPKPETFGVQFRSGNHGKSGKTPSGKNMKNKSPKKMINHVETVSKWCLNGTKTNGNLYKNR